MSGTSIKRRQRDTSRPSLLALEPALGGLLSGREEELRAPLLASQIDCSSWSDAELVAYCRTHADADWPSDPDAVPDLRLVQEERARRGGYALPGYRTRREYEEAVAAIRKPVMKAVGPTVLSPNEAARRFLLDVRTDVEVRYSHHELSEAYARHCERHNLVPLAVNQFRPALKASPGVLRTHEEITPGASAKRRRERPFIWIIAPRGEEAVMLKRAA